MATGISDDMITMFVIDDALRRDLEHLNKAVEHKDAEDPARRQAFTAGWEAFKFQLHHHHTSEDDFLWPRVGTHLSDRPDDLALLDAMEAEHERIGPAITEIAAALGDTDLPGQDGAGSRLPAPESSSARLPEAATTFGRELVDHLVHEERVAVPLVESVMSRQDWRDFSKHQQKSTGLKGAAEFFPYVLSGADPERGAQTLALYPPPLRMIIRRVWVPRYRRRALWS